ncbi:hypothetical protein LNKW23_34860 [Paralimibaculum aggregatum]|uniref:Uncharacterized protein n=1 Tax=Paralimibaculum aggregatum TaxID=3036245 RepID=A0ABQ6LM39_9RHOB|nr:hypothetical protein [Limibaculum sp. NKW23]GMG84271.1 hypothetical protein LNKW23_34860 [Limibaculum sp. NKW23]
MITEDWLLTWALMVAATGLFALPALFAPPWGWLLAVAALELGALLWLRAEAAAAMRMLDAGVIRLAAELGATGLAIGVLGAMARRFLPGSRRRAVAAAIAAVLLLPALMLAGH